MGAETRGKKEEQAMSAQQFIALERDRFGSEEVPSEFPVLRLVTDGYTLNELRLHTAKVYFTKQVGGTSQPALGIDYVVVDIMKQLPDDPGGTPQRIVFVFSIKFTSTDSFPTTAAPVNVTITASVERGGGLPSIVATAEMQLRQEASPFMIDGGDSSLSADLRVFHIRAGESALGAWLIGGTCDAPCDFIKQAIKNLDLDPRLFDTLDSSATEVAINEKDNQGRPIFNFAVARVHYRAKTQFANNVRVFFRLCYPSPWLLEYDQGSTYRRSSATDPIPLAGAPNGTVPDPASTGDWNLLFMPCFAEPRVPPTASMMTQTDPSNVKPAIPPDPNGGEVVRFFGCWLDTNQPSQTRFRMDSLIDGPFASLTNTAPPQPLNALMSYYEGSVLSVVAEVAYDPDPIPPRATPSSSDKLAQRNLTFKLI